MNPSAETSSEADSSGADDPDLPIGARISAAVIGVAVVATGVVATFRTANELPAVALVLAGSAFLLIAVQSTPLIRLGTSSASFELARLRRRVRRVAQSALTGDQSPDVSRGLVDALAAIDPSLKQRPAVAAAIYEKQVEAAILRQSARWQAAGLTRVEQDNSPVDFVASRGKQCSNVVVKFRAQGPLRLRDVRLDQVANPTLVVTNAPLSGEMQEHNSSSTGLIDDVPYIEFVTWNDERDDGILTRAFDRTFSRATSVA